MAYIQVHIVQRGALQPLIELLTSPDPQLKEMSAFALGRLAQVIICSILCFLLMQFKRSRYIRVLNRQSTCPCCTNTLICACVLNLLLLKFLLYDIWRAIYNHSLKKKKKDVQIVDQVA